MITSKLRGHESHMRVNASLRVEALKHCKAFFFFLPLIRRLGLAQDG